MVAMRVTVGRVGRPHGVRGDVVVGVRTDEPELRFAVGSRLDTDPPGAGPLVVASSRWRSGELLVRFEGITGRDAAAGLRGLWLTLDAAAVAPSADPDEFRDMDLVGLAVRTVDGQAVGNVTDVLHHGQDLLIVRRASGGDVMVPFVKALVPVVDLAGGVLVIDPPAGLLSLEETQ